jgi:hypothetical protein
MPTSYDQLQLISSKSFEFIIEIIWSTGIDLFEKPKNTFDECMLV